MKNSEIPFLLQLALILICIFGIGYLAKLGQSILSPMFFAFLMALVFLPVANFLEKEARFSRNLSTFICLLVMLFSSALIIFFFGNQLSNFADDFPNLEKQITKSVSELQNWIAKTFHLNFAKQSSYLNQGLNKILASTGIILSYTLSMFGSVLGFLAFSLLFFIFILNYRKQLYKFLVDVFDKQHTNKVSTAMTETQAIIKQYILGLVIQIIIVSLITSILLTILDVKYAILLGVLTGLLNIIPYIGILISCLLSCLISFTTGSNNTLFVFLGYIAIHAIDSNIILPLVVGSKVNINALFSFIALLIGEHLWGISGMFLSIPFLAILKIIFDRIDNMKAWANLISEEIDISKKAKSLLLKKIKPKEKSKKD